MPPAATCGSTAMRCCHLLEGHLRVADATNVLHLREDVECIRSNSGAPIADLTFGDRALGVLAVVLPLDQRTQVRIQWRIFPYVSGCDRIPATWSVCIELITSERLGKLAVGLHHPT